GAGMGWVLVVANLNAAAQSAAPDWARARVLSIYLVVFFGAMSGGSAFWGAVASNSNIPIALAGAAAIALLGIVGTVRFQLARTESLDLAPAKHWPDPVL